MEIGKNVNNLLDDEFNGETLDKVRQSVERSVSHSIWMLVVKKVWVREISSIKNSIELRTIWN